MNSKDAATFFDANHLYGNRGASFYCGLEYGGQIVSAISVIERSGQFELMRFANLLGHCVVGGFSKMLKFAQKSVGFPSIYTYADRRYSTANSYISSGFVPCGITKPGYRYWKSNKTYDRRKFQKHRLPGLLPEFDPGLTEAENMFANGYRRIWDAGHHKLIMVAKNT